MKERNAYLVLENLTKIKLIISLIWKQISLSRYYAPIIDVILFIFKTCNLLKLIVFIFSTMMVQKNAPKIDL